MNHSAIEEISTEEKKAYENSKAYKVFTVFRKICVYLFAVLIVVGALLFAADKSPNKSFFGIRYYTVLTPSMEPEFSAGDMVFVKITDADSINVGDIITFNPSSGGEAYLTHRVVEKLPNYQGTGITCFRTKGDANDTQDSFLIDEDRVIGTVQFHIPKIGVIIRFVQLKWYFIVPLIILMIVFFRMMKYYFELHAQNSSNSETVPVEQISEGGEKLPAEIIQNKTEE